MNYEKAYKDALERAKTYWESPRTCFDIDALKEIFPEFQMSEDENAMKELLAWLKNKQANPSIGFSPIKMEQWIAWLEKQGKRDARYKYLEELLEADTIYQMAMNDAMVEEAKTKAINALSELEIGKLLGIEKQAEHTDEEKVLIGARKGVALSIMNFLDRNTLGMDLSSMECADLESAVIDSDWSKVYDYMKKKLEKQGEKKYIDDLTQQEAMDIAVAKCFEQGEQKPVDKVEPKFKVGDWITDGYIHCKISDVLDDRYIVDTKFAKRSAIQFKHENNYHLWSIKDAKDGDVLFHSDSASNGIFIFKELLKYEFSEKVICYCDYDSEDGFCLGEHHTCCWADAKILHPATKEQRDTLIKAMTDAGYTFDFEKKELKKIHIIDEGKAEMDYCFTKMMNGEKVTPAWGEDDEQYLLVCKNALRKYQVTDKWDSDIISQWLDNKLKPLIPQINVTDKELGQAKKDAYNETLDKIEYHDDWPTFDDGWDAAIWYLKKRNGIPQNRWKPTDGQMKALKEACDKSWELDGLDPLYTLYEDLKKLKVD